MIGEYLSKRSAELLLDKMPKNESIMNEIFEFDVENLESTSSVKISQFIIGLSQFIIYFSSQVNRTKVTLLQKRNVLESHINKSSVKYRTKVERKIKVLEDNPDLQDIVASIAIDEQELALVENREQYLLELVNAFKRELTRRELEYRMSRVERTI